MQTLIDSAIFVVTLTVVFYLFYALFKRAS